VALFHSLAKPLRADLRRRTVACLSVLVLAGALVDCGGGSSHAPPCTNCMPSSFDFVYQANANQVSGFEVDSQSGTVQTTLSPATSAVIPGGIIVTAGDYLYVTEAEGSGGVVFGYSVNSSTGALTALPGSPFSTGVAQPAQGMAADPAGHFLYVTVPNTNQVAAFTIGANGALPAITGSPFGTNDTRPVAAAVDSSGKLLFVSNQDSASGSISVFSIDSATGVPKQVAGSPFATLPNGGPASLTVDPKASRLYVPMLNAGVVLGFSFDSSGAPTPLSGSPYAVVSQPNSVTIDPSEKFLFSADFSGDVSSFTIDPSTGALTAVAGSPFPVSENPFQVAVNASASLLIVSCANESTIPAFTIDSAEVLTTAAPLDGGGTSGGVAIVHKSS